MRVTVIFMVEKTPKGRGSSRHLYNVGVYGLYSSSIIFLDEMNLACWTYEEEDRSKDALERPVNRRGDDIEMYLRMGNMGCFNMAHVGMHGRHWW